jgi:glycosyltransferase involved in cell wall biosynthesis
MGVGVPQIVPNIGGYKEYCSKETTMMVEPKHRYYLPSVYSAVGGEAHVCDPKDICSAIEEYLNDSDKRRLHGQKAKEAILKYTWPNVTRDLVKAIKDECDDM